MASENAVVGLVWRSNPIAYVAAAVVAVTICWIGIHAIARVAWSLQTSAGQKHRQTALRSVFHAVLLIAIELFALILSAKTINSVWGDAEPGLLALLGAQFLVIPVFGLVLGKTAWRNDTIRFGLGKGLSASLVVTTMLCAWIAWAGSFLSISGEG
jgi:hypothetical protein